MFVDQLTASVEAAAYPRLNEIAKTVWSAWSAGHLSDDQAQRLAETIDRRKGGYRGQGLPSNSAPAGFSRARARVKQRSPDRIHSIERRRRLAASGPMPPTLADKFTTGELAVLRIVADEIRKYGTCSAYVDELAARAGVCRTTAQNAIRAARAHRLITVEERRRRGQASLTNIVKIISAEWRTWLRLGTGFKKSSTTDIRLTKVENDGQKFGRTSHGIGRIAVRKAVGESNGPPPR
jgi:hypothetical protein